MNAKQAARELVERVTGRPGFTSATGVRILLAEPGRVHLTLTRRPDLLQFSGYFHGGVIAGLADHAAGGAVTTALPPGKMSVTIDLHITFVSPADGESIIARARALHVGKTLCFANVEVANLKEREERLCAFATATLRAIDMPCERA